MRVFINLQLFACCIALIFRVISEYNFHNIETRILTKPERQFLTKNFGWDARHWLHKIRILRVSFLLLKYISRVLFREIYETSLYSFQLLLILNFRRTDTRYYFHKSIQESIAFVKNIIKKFGMLLSKLIYHVIQYYLIQIHKIYTSHKCLQLICQKYHILKHVEKLYLRRSTKLFCLSSYCTYIEIVGKAEVKIKILLTRFRGDFSINLETRIACTCIVMASAGRFAPWRWTCSGITT